jgi:hypothetical protein
MYILSLLCVFIHIPGGSFIFNISKGDFESALVSWGDFPAGRAVPGLHRILAYTHRLVLSRDKLSLDKETTDRDMPARGDSFGEQQFQKGCLIRV